MQNFAVINNLGHGNRQLWHNDHENSALFYHSHSSLYPTIMKKETGDRERMLLLQASGAIDFKQPNSLQLVMPVNRAPIMYQGLFHKATLSLWCL